MKNPKEILNQGHQGNKYVLGQFWGNWDSGLCIMGDGRKGTYIYIAPNTYQKNTSKYSSKFCCA